MILPFIEQSDLYNQYDFAEPWDGPKNRLLAGRMPRLFAFHGVKREGNAVTNFLAVVGAGTAWPGPKAVPRDDATDGTCTTVLLVENHGANVHWMEPRDLSFADMDFRVNSPHGVSSQYEDPAVLMLDGSLHRLKPALAPGTLRALMTIQGGEILQGSETAGWELLQDGRQRLLREP